MDRGTALLRAWLRFQREMGVRTLPSRARALLTPGGARTGGGGNGLQEQGPSARKAPRPAFSPPSTLEELKMTLSSCTMCHLHRTRTRPVQGTGPEGAKVAVVVDPPGAAEESAGRPCTGEAWELLKRMLSAIELDPEAVYITPALKCRVHGRTPPSRDSVERCGLLLGAELDLVAPAAVLLMGAAAVRAALGSGTALPNSRGKVVSRGGRSLVSTYSPAAILGLPPQRQTQLKRLVWEDLKLFRDKCL